MKICTLKAHCHSESLREFRVAKNCHLGNNSQSEHWIQHEPFENKRTSVQRRLGEHGPLGTFLSCYIILFFLSLGFVVYIVQLKIQINLVFDKL